MRNILFITISFLALFLTSCNLEKEIDIDLPTYEGRLFLECYLEPGQPYSLLLTRTAPYFESFPSDTAFLTNILEDSATVIIRVNGEEHLLQDNLFLNPLTGKIFNYYSFDLVPENYEDSFELDVVLKNGKSITAETKILKPVKFDSIRTEFAENDTLARVIAYATDDTSQDNYYRRMLHFSSLDSIPIFDFPLDDRATEGTMVFGSFYDFIEGDTVINTLFSIDRPYFDFLQTIQFAISANGNPFGQPSPISTNLEGDAEAIGIFTGLSYDRQVTIVER